MIPNTTDTDTKVFALLASDAPTSSTGRARDVLDELEGAITAKPASTLDRASGQSHDRPSRCDILVALAGTSASTMNGSI